MARVRLADRHAYFALSVPLFSCVVGNDDMRLLIMAQMRPSRTAHGVHANTARVRSFHCFESERPVKRGRVPAARSNTQQARHETPPWLVDTPRRLTAHNVFLYVMERRDPGSSYRIGSRGDCQSTRNADGEHGWGRSPTWSAVTGGRWAVETRGRMSALRGHSVGSPVSTPFIFFLFARDARPAVVTRGGDVGVGRNPGTNQFGRFVGGRGAGMNDHRGVLLAISARQQRRAMGKRLAPGNETHAYIMFLAVIARCI